MAGGTPSHSCPQRVWSILDRSNTISKLTRMPNLKDLGWVERSQNEYGSITGGGTLPRLCLC